MLEAAARQPERVARQEGGAATAPGHRRRRSWRRCTRSPSWLTQPWSPMSCAASVVAQTVPTSGLGTHEGWQARHPEVTASITGLPARGYQGPNTTLSGRLGRRFEQDFVTETRGDRQGGERARVRRVGRAKNDMAPSTSTARGTYNALAAGIGTLRGRRPLAWSPLAGLGRPSHIVPAIPATPRDRPHGRSRCAGQHPVPIAQHPRLKPS